MKGLKGINYIWKCLDKVIVEGNDLYRIMISVSWMNFKEKVMEVLEIF